VDVAVVRGGDVVARADGVEVSGGDFSVGAGAWRGGAADPLRPGDRIRIVPRSRFERAALSFDVASSGARATVGGVFRSAEGAPAGEPASTGGKLAPTGGKPGVAPAAPAAPGEATGGRGAQARPAWCARRLWTRGSGRSARAALLGLRRSQLEGCLGSASSARGGRLRFGRALEVALVRGRVSAFTLRDRSFRSEGGAFGVGSRLSALRRALPAASAGGRRALLRHGRGYAEVRVTPRGRVAATVTVTYRTGRELDRTARALRRRLG
jgi:hypothetical protein